MPLPSPHTHRTHPPTYTHTQELYLRRNQLRCLPDNIGDLSKLDTIYLESNQLDENGLPDSFAELESLKGLPLHKNRFTTIPSSVFALVNLEELYVWRVEGGERGRQERGRKGDCAVVLVLRTVCRTAYSYT